MWPALIPAAVLAYGMTLVCLTLTALVRHSLRDTQPSERAAILSSLARVVRAWADTLRFWRRR
ncbi:hypothetical protein SAMN02745831_00386 [Streptomyces sp. PgraA7]|nr:hypothetical protein SAMN02745831_00386 [Streptomyces sp. PgraA7]